MEKIETNNYILTRISSDSSLDEKEEQNSKVPILTRQIKSCITKPYKELNIADKKKLDYEIIRFDLSFSSEEYTYNWIVYHTPKEIKKNIKEIYSNIVNRKFKITKPVHPIIIQLDSSKEIIENLPIITDFYSQLISEPSVQNEELLTVFFNIGYTSFLKENNGVKPFEGLLKKKAYNECCSCFCPSYNKRWVVVNDDHIFYLNQIDWKEGKVVYFFDRNMQIIDNGKKYLKIKNLSMTLNLKFKDYFEKEIWKKELEKRKLQYNLLVESNKYNSYTNEKKYNVCQWFVDGKDYFEDLYQKLMEAKYTIFITDWWMSPELFLRRPVDEKIYIEMSKSKILTKNFGEEMTRLMDILNYKAQQGVKIYLLIYYECSLALTLNSEHTEETFRKINKKIKIIRHPSDAFTLLWSHHEKLVIIDQIIAYVGGLDLCWGRYDNHNHPIYEGPNPQNIYEFPLIDYSNARICDFSNVEKYCIESVSRKDSLRMPWHDVHSRIIGPVVSDIARHFIERWNHANFEDRKEKGITSIDKTVVYPQNKFNFWQKLAENVKNKNETKTLSENNNAENNINKKDSFQELNNENLKIGAQENKRLQENFMKGKTKIDDDHLLIRNDNTTQSLSLAPKNKKNSYYSHFVQLLGKTGNKAINIDEEIEITKLGMYRKYFFPDKIMSRVQVLRSASEWSAGLKKTENSILQGYYNLIKESNHYIYIENQFFISKSWTDEEKKACPHLISDIVKNEVALYLRQRIERAYENKENFKVYIFLPLLPGFAGEPEDSPTLQIIMKHTYAGICRNYGLSIIEQLEKKMGDKWRNYIGFYLLRNHGIINDAPKTEIIYIHSKLMIVDDTKVLIGSANINDRSLIGKRDSEFAVIIKEQKEFIDKRTGKNYVMNGNNNYRANHFAVSFRKSLMAEHLGISPDDPILDDPLSNELHSLIISRAKNNTEIYRDLFGCYPDDYYTNFKLLKNIKKKRKEEDPKILLQKYNELKNKIAGHIVEFPLLFLKEERLGISFFSVENLIPEYNFT